ncbi:hypothetical protein AOQ84DRAFT_391748 [Glonium stellatum]|uniref:Uncharacterized protein n=1 Tax=Glonium stellatum TaxID=574774 RepID=A0A8E2ESQ2_9PEZI|nr:hypothetical protein AOQ84DRAFT_391748 [Glonium stellatum]
MAATSISSSTSDISLTVHPDIPGLHREYDPTTLSLRHDAAIELDRITSNINNNVHASASRGASSSAAPTESIWSSRKASSVTKPTSNGTSYPVVDSNGKGKVAIVSASSSPSSSMTATHGSGSDTERDQDFACLGSWAGASSVPPPEKSNKRAKKPKKPNVIIQNGKQDKALERPTSDTHEAHYVADRGQKYLRHRRINLDNDELHLAEEGRVFEIPAKSPSAPLSHSRIVAIVVLIAAIVLTVSLSAWGVSRTGTSRIGCTKAIIFSATIGIVIFTAGVMVAARRVLMEVLLMALLEVFIGSVLLVEIRELM